MSDDPTIADNNASDAGADELQKEFSAFTQVVGALQVLTPSSREKLFRTLATFFSIELYSASPRALSLPSQVWGNAVLPPPQPARPFSEDRTISPKDFLLEKKPSTDIERVACLGYYLAHYRDTPFFKTLDISKLNTEAAQVKFSNAAKAVDNASKAGLLVQATKGQKQLSAMGEQYVQALPDRAAAREAVAHFRQRRRKSKNRQSNSPFAPAINDSSDETE